MGGSDFGEELDEMDILRCAQVSEICESLVHSLQILENPQMRYLLATVSPKLSRQGPRGNRPEGDEPVTYIVVPKLRAGMVKTFQGDLFSVYLLLTEFEVRTISYEESYCSFAYRYVAYVYIDGESVYSTSSAVKQTSETLRKTSNPVPLFYIC